MSDDLTWITNQMATTIISDFTNTGELVNARSVNECALLGMKCEMYPASIKTNTYL